MQDWEGDYGSVHLLVAFLVRLYRGGVFTLSFSVHILCVGTGHLLVASHCLMVMLPFFCRLRVQVAIVCLRPSRHP